MTSYIVLSRSENPADIDARVIGDRFAWLGFFLGGLWLLWHRAWFAGALVLIADIAIALATAATGQYLLGTAIDIGLALFVGLEANQWRVAALRAKGYRMVDVIAADDPGTAFAIYATRQAGTPAGRATPPPLPGATSRRANPGASGMIGLVPTGREY